ncbi:hypothetical protein, partial [Stenotrophomonas maltophilia group sp. RNC7]|uniref:hypothetical protein n=1 Tax=Stenotrophomonas maltophilia group sp. RNC7 TaxID=3071467 RepID=UPI0027DFE927
AGYCRLNISLRTITVSSLFIPLIWKGNQDAVVECKMRYLGRVLVSLPFGSRTEYREFKESGQSAKCLVSTAGFPVER